MTRETMASRRGQALWIRLRQEAEKRLAAASPAPRFEGAASAASVLSPGAARAARDASLAQYLRGRPALAAAFPHVDTRAAATLPDANAVVAAADRVLRGEWEVFGKRFREPPGGMRWRAHPFATAGGGDTPATHWHLVRFMDGETGGDVKELWELNRHEALVRLAQGYRLTGDERYADALLSLLDGWMEQNAPGTGINWASALEVAFRAAAWCWIWQLTRHSPAWTEDRVARFVWQLWHHANHVERYDSVHHSPNTHLTGEAVGMLYVGTCFPEMRRARHWRLRGLEILATEIGHQILTDGMHFERSTGYHRYTAEFYLHAWLLARQVGAAGGGTASQLRDALERLLVVSAALRRPDGSWPVFGDEDGGRLLRLGDSAAVDQRPLLVAGAGIFADAHLAWARDENASAFAESWWLLGDPEWEALGARGTRGTRAPATDLLATVDLPDAGYRGARAGQGSEEWFCLVDCGPHAGAVRGHAHSDLGHVEVAFGGERVIADPGCPTYSGDAALRSWCRSEEAHACLCVPGLPMATPVGRFSWGVVPDDAEAAVIEGGGVWLLDLRHRRTGAAGDIVHRRQVALIAGAGVVVCDWIAAPRGEGLRPALHWPIPRPPASLRAREAGAAGSLAIGGVRMTWHSWDGRGVTAGVRPAVHSPTFGVRTEGSVLVVRPTGLPPAGIVTCFASREEAFVIRPEAAGGFVVTARATAGNVTLALHPDGGAMVAPAADARCEVDR